jgi:isopenicillin-N epimerase
MPRWSHSGRGKLSRVNPDIARHFLIEPGLAYLNHGSFGACPIPVLEFQSDLRARMERDAVSFLDVELPERLEYVRERVGAFIAARPEDLVFVPNSTTAVNAVLRSRQPSFHPGDELLTTDHEYNATLNAIAFVARGSGAKVVVANVPFPIGSPDQVIDAILDRVTQRTRLAMFSWITSATALIFPVERLAAALSERGVEVLVDAAHAPGQVPIDMARLERAGVTYLTGNGHKWLCSPKGTAFLWVRPDRQADIHPLVISHGTNAPMSTGGRSRFQLEFDWPGTPDPTPVLSLPAAIDFIATLHEDGWPGVMAANHELVLQGQGIVCAALGATTRPTAPDDMLAAMATLPVPEDLEPRARAALGDLDPDVTLANDSLREDLVERERIQVPVFPWPAKPSLGPSRRWLRISAQRYNDLDDYRRLAGALERRAGTRTPAA